jgi:hypothetical protein
LLRTGRYRLKKGVQLRIAAVNEGKGFNEELGAETWIVANLYLAVADFHESCTIRVTIKIYCTVIEAK